ncbi:hypothetical protein GobsT_11290 [Gemmata obscuriglobus]|nr:hypothetical protein [Gemmata obscuriglobus]QEG26390.1 hypothetical protein GobsT_11290 [Gemmata obscuriglobus]VTS01460.1 unnamed protein product [Gemmata obscuriglobus UQM 2246]
MDEPPTRVSPEVERLGRCDECGAVKTLMDMAHRAAQRGHQYSRPDSFVIVCEPCGYVERISDSALYYATVVAIRVLRAAEIVPAEPGAAPDTAR